MSCLRSEPLTWPCQVSGSDQLNDASCHSVTSITNKHFRKCDHQIEFITNHPVHASSPNLNSRCRSRSHSWSWTAISALDDDSVSQGKPQKMTLTLTENSLASHWGFHVQRSSDWKTSQKMTASTSVTFVLHCHCKGHRFFILDFFHSSSRGQCWCQFYDKYRQALDKLYMFLFLLLLFIHWTTSNICKMCGFLAKNNLFMVSGLWTHWWVCLSHRIFTMIWMSPYAV